MIVEQALPFLAEGSLSGDVGRSNIFGNSNHAFLGFRQQNRIFMWVFL